jgi:hypothetical protein
MHQKPQKLTSQRSTLRAHLRPREIKNEPNGCTKSLQTELRYLQSKKHTERSKSNGCTKRLQKPTQSVAPPSTREQRKNKRPSQERPRGLKPSDPRERSRLQALGRARAVPRARPNRDRGENQTRRTEKVVLIRPVDT